MRSAIKDIEREERRSRLLRWYFRLKDEFMRLRREFGWKYEDKREKIKEIMRRYGAAREGLENDFDKRFQDIMVLRRYWAICLHEEELGKAYDEHGAEKKAALDELKRRENEELESCEKEHEQYRATSWDRLIKIKEVSRPC
ncbi:hypothetical protein HY995_00890 [Candidatus Micrarchaeota archaeon]|nr:hypothetical protein [Candidatus Micrarchaeota archaeon]